MIQRKSIIASVFGLMSRHVYRVTPGDLVRCDPTHSPAASVGLVVTVSFEDDEGYQKEVAEVMWVNPEQSDEPFVQQCNTLTLLRL